MTCIASIRPEVAAFTPYVPGLGADEVRNRFGLSQVIKLASNENPLGTSPLVQQVLRSRADTAFRYPAPGNPELTRAIAGHHGLNPARIVPGNGSDEIIDLLVRMLAVPGRHEALTFSPCFGIYSTQTALCGVTLRQTPLNPDFSFPWDSLLAMVNEQTTLVFVTTPDNPSGFCPPVGDLVRLAEALPPACLLVVDEAYMDFCDDEAAHSLLPRLDEFPNIAILRTFSKSRGLAGLRLGYGILPEIVAEYMRRVRLPFSVNALAEAAGVAALRDDVFYRETLRVVREGREQLAQGLRALGCTVYPSMANFLMFGLPASCPATMANVYTDLLARGVITRPLASYNLPHLLRVSVGLPEENTFFLQVLGEVLAA
ncbi:MAG: histidinol-phosphate transaminase [Deltaproteobacteria bacterium]|jgi:histidinol-phosphate aminotransferase|nr:histidinol-phosphate transaminase [Deltaproteobacteria bacterium]